MRRKLVNSHLSVSARGVNPFLIGLGLEPSGLYTVAIQASSWPHGARPQSCCLPSTRILHLLLTSTSISSMTMSSANFGPILDAALDHYAKQTGIDLAKHPSAEKLQNCHSLEDVVQILLERETAFKDYRDKYRKLNDCLRPVVQIVHGFSGVMGEAAGLVSSKH